MGKNDKEKLVSTSAAMIEKFLEVAGSVSNNPCVQLSAILPSIVEKILLEKRVIKTNISEKLQMQLKEVISAAIKNCEEKLNSQYLVNKLALLKPYVSEFEYENITYDKIHVWIDEILSKEIKEHDMYITQEELNSVWDVFIEEFESVVLDYPELTGYVLLSKDKQLQDLIKKQSVDNGQDKIPRILTEKAPLPPEEYYGREKEFNDILDKMETESKLVLVNGMGGVLEKVLWQENYIIIF